MGADRNPDAFQDVPVAYGLAVVDRQPGIVDRLVHHAKRIGDRRPAEIVDGAGPVAFAGRVDLVDRHHFARPVSGQQVVVVKAPVRGSVAAERQALELRIGTGTRHHVEDAHFEDVAGLSPADKDRAGADMHAQAFSITLGSTAAIDPLFVLGPEIDALRAGIALDHAFMIVVRLMCQGLDGDEVSGIDLELRLQVFAEIAPMHRVRIGRQIMMAGARGLFDRRGLRQGVRYEGEPAGGQ